VTLRGSLDDLSFSVWPPAIDISTPANPQIFKPQFGVANNSATDTVSLTSAVLLVPVTTGGTNLAANTDMTPNAITPGWTFNPDPEPPPGYVAFDLLPNDGIGEIPPGGSVAFTLSGVKVNTVPGTATLQLSAQVAINNSPPESWTPTCQITLTPPSTTPQFGGLKSIRPADRQAACPLQGQFVIITWTSSGATSVTVSDDQGNSYPDQPTSGTFIDTPQVGNAAIKTSSKLGRYYERQYTLTANGAGAEPPDTWQPWINVQLPTILSIKVSPQSITPGQSVTVSWSVANIDPNLGTIALTLAPTDGTGPYVIGIPSNQMKGSGVVTPTPLTSTTYTLTVTNGYGATATAQQPVISTLQPGWQEMKGLETLGAPGMPIAFDLVAFKGRLWCCIPVEAAPTAPGLYWTVDGASWTAATLPENLVDGLVAADLGGGEKLEKLWAFGAEPFLASSSDGAKWDTMPTPSYPGRISASYLVHGGTIFVLGGTDASGNGLKDVWSTTDGRIWTEVGNTFPGQSLTETQQGAVAFAGKLYTVCFADDQLPWCYSSADGAKNWVRQSTPIVQSSGVIGAFVWLSLQVVGDKLLLFGLYDSNGNSVPMAMDATGAWSPAGQFSSPSMPGLSARSAAIYRSYLWVSLSGPAPGGGQLSARFFVFNQVLPNTTFTLAPTPKALRDSLDDLSFGVFPPAIDISTPANKQIFSPQFSVANSSATDTVSLTSATLQVPVTTNGTNLAQNTNMAPNAITPGWTFTPDPDPQPGCAAFDLLPDDGIGEIPPGGSVAFTLNGVEVNTVPGTATLQLQAQTSAGTWTPTCQITLTQPSTIPTITRYSITPADPQTLTTLQGQPVVLSWTTSGAAYCMIEDDQGNKLLNPLTGTTSLPTSGTLADTPLQGGSPVQSTPKLGLYYTRTYTLYAESGGAVQPDEQPNPAIIQLPTVSSFAVSPASITLGQQVTVSWSVANIDPNLGTITLTLAPTDGSGPYTISIPASQTSGSGVVTPTPLATTTCTLTIANGHGATVSSAPQTVTSPLQPGWQEMNGLNLELKPSQGQSLAGFVAFGGRLWCCSTGPAEPGLSWTVDGTSWTAVTPQPSLPQLDGLIAADLGDGDKLWAFGFGSEPWVASSSDGITWDKKPTPPYRKRSSASYLAHDRAILVLGGQENGVPFTDVWSTKDGSTWTQVGNAFPAGSKDNYVGDVQTVAALAGKLYTLANTYGGDSVAVCCNSSADGGKTWVQLSTKSSMILFRFALQPVGAELLVLGMVDPQHGITPMLIDATGAFSAAGKWSPPATSGDGWYSAIYLGCLWVALDGGDSARFFLCNQVLPDTTFTLTPKTMRDGSRIKHDA
jgi:hypothetical protein